MLRIEKEIKSSTVVGGVHTVVGGQSTCAHHYLKVGAGSKQIFSKNVQVGNGLGLFPVGEEKNLLSFLFPA